MPEKPNQEKPETLPKRKELVNLIEVSEFKDLSLDTQINVNMSVINDKINMSIEKVAD